MAARREARAATETRHAAASRELVETRRLGERERAVLVERGTSLTSELERMSGAIAERESRIVALVADAARADAASSADDERSAALDARVAERSIDLETATLHATSIRAEVDQGHRALGEASTRLEVLQRMHESSADLDPGVREALAAGRDGQLKGICGTVAQLLLVPGSSKSPSRSR